MKRVFFAAILIALAMPVHAGEFWNRLWRNADQQGDVLLQKGDAKSAAGAYADPRRKAYAELQAGDYKGAAQILDKLHDGDADYNRGNALAHMGDLQGALRAYDAALQKNPNDKDAKHNRDLVANALKQQHSQQQKTDSNKSQKDQGRQDKDSSGQSNGQDKNKGQEKSGRADQKSASGQDAAGQNRQQGNAGEQPGSKNVEQNGASREEKAQNGNGGAKAGQARQDAAASSVGSGDTGNDAETSVPKSEQQIEEAQWLHSIPDDPGGLLRRKFLIEHMIRQQRSEQ